MQDKLKPAAIGGVALGIASGIPFINMANCACCAWVIGGGVLACYLYLQNAPASAQAPYGDTAILGLLTGAFGALTAAVVALPFSMIFNSGDTFAQISEALATEDVPPELQELMASLGAGGGGCIGFVMSLVVGMIIYPVFATAGTLLGTAIFHKNQPQAPSYPPAGSPPPPPVT